MNVTLLFRLGRMLLLGGWILAARGAGLPEPSVVFFGVVTDELGQRLTQGSFVLQLESPAASTPVRVEVTLTNLHGQFSYVAFLPAETALTGRSRSPGHLALARTSETWRVLRPAWGAGLLTPLPASRSNLVVNTASRGALVRTDFTLGVDTDGNGLMDAWEQRYFGRLGNDPLGNPAGDGISNLAKMYAGLDPRGTMVNPPQFTVVQSLPDGSFQVEWSSEAGRRYTLHRADRLEGPFSALRANVLATPPANRFVDTEATTQSAFFYRVELLP